MKIDNPFSKEQIKNYILAYVGVVVIMILFFIASSLFYTPKEYPKKEFERSKSIIKPKREITKEEKKQVSSPHAVKLLQKGYE